MNPRQMTNEQLMAYLSQVQMAGSLRQAFGGAGIPNRQDTFNQAMQADALREALAEVQRRREGGQLTDRQLALQEINIADLARMVEEQAVRNAEASIALEERLDPRQAQMRRAGQEAVAQIASGGAAGQAAQNALIQQALNQAGVRTRTETAESIATPRIDTRRTVLPDAPQAPQLGVTPAVATERLGAAGSADIALAQAARLGTTPQAGQVGIGGVQRVNMPTLGTTPQAGQVAAADAVGAGRTVQDVSDLQREVERRAMEDLALGGRLSAEQRGEVIRQALASAGAAGVTGGTMRDITARDLGLSSIAMERERRERASRAGEVTEARNARQAQLDAAREASLAEARNTTNRINAQLEAARAQFNAGLISQAQLTEFESRARAAMQDASAGNEVNRINAQLEAARAQFNAGLISQAQLTQFEQDARIALANADATNRANLVGFEASTQNARINAAEANQNARFIASLQDARERFNAGQMSDFAMAAYQAAVQSGMRDTDAVNEALRVEAQMLFSGQERARDRGFQAGESAADREQAAIRTALSTLQGGEQLRLQAGQIGASAERPLAGLDPSSVADLLVAQTNARNQWNMQQEAIRRQQESANLAAQSLQTQSRVRASTNSGAQYAPVAQTISSPSITATPSRATAPVGGSYALPAPTTPSALRTGAQAQGSRVIAPFPTYTMNPQTFQFERR